MVPGEQFEQDANSTESSEPQVTETPQQSSAPEGQAQPEKQASPEVPFHEHPRFKELIEERRKYQGELQTYQQQVAEMQAQFQELQRARQEAQKQEDPLLSRLKSIDPEFGKWAESQTQLAKELDDFKSWRREVQQRELRSQYESTIDRLHSENKVPEGLKSFYRRQIDAMAMSNPKLGLNDLPQVYKSVHDEFSKLLDETKRSERASYVTDKSKDGSTPPSVSRGKPPGPSKGKSEFTGDREQDLALIAKRALKLSKADSEL